MTDIEGLLFRKFPKIGYKKTIYITNQVQAY